MFFRWWEIPAVQIVFQVGSFGDNPYTIFLGQNQWYHFGVGAPPILVYLDVHWGCGLLTHGHMFAIVSKVLASLRARIAIVRQKLRTCWTQA